METNKNSHPNKKEKNSNFFEYFRFGESYTSLILGIIVVIIATSLILGIVHNINVVNRAISKPPKSPNLIQVSQTNTETIISTGSDNKNQLTSPKIKTKISLTPTPQAVTITAKPTKQPIMKKQTNPSPTKASLGKSVNKEKTYVVKEGDNLWNISVSKYKNGYKWVDIARTNNLSNPDYIVVGQKIIFPKIEQKKDTPDILPEAASTSIMKENAKISGNEYKVAYGDTLWTIAVRAYGDGYQWVKISRTNKLSNPDLIYPGDKLTIPRR